MNTNKIIPCIWVSSNEGKISNVINYYQTVFEKHMIIGMIIPLGETPNGYAEMCEIRFFDQKFSFMSTSIPHHDLNDSISMMIQCSDQEEIDHFWNYFTKEGSEAPCGWCIDKFGLRWQITPINLEELMQKPKAFDILMNQKKIVIAEFYS